MSIRRGWSRVLFLVVPVVLMAAACGGQSRPDRPAQTLKEFFGSSSDEQILAREAAFHYRMQQLMVQCMDKAGFAYQVLQYEHPRNLPPGGRSSPAFGKRYAYGISTVVGVSMGPSPRPDPNQPYVNRLDADDRAAYQAAWRRCEDQSYHAVYGPMVEAEQRLQPKQAALEASIQADQRMRAAMRAWSSCMLARGHRFQSPEAIRQHLQARLKPLVGEGGQPKVSTDRGRLASLQREERALYLADQRCRTAHVEAVETAVRRELEPPFVSRNYELLDRLRQPGSDGSG